MNTRMAGPAEPAFLVYDGQCPFCANYVALLRLRETFPGLQLLDARAQRDHPLVQSLAPRGVRIDDGMALVVGDQIHHGAESIHQLALRVADRTGFGRLNWVLFRSRLRSAVLYPWLRAG